MNKVNTQESDKCCPGNAILGDQGAVSKDGPTNCFLVSEDGETRGVQHRLLWI